MRQVDIPANWPYTHRQHRASRAVARPYASINNVWSAEPHGPWLAHSRRNIDVVSAAPDRFVGATHGELLDWFAAGLHDRIKAEGYRLVEPGGKTDDGGIVLHAVGPEGPKSFRRRNRAVFVVGLGEAENYPEEPLKTGYPLLLRTLANLFLLIVHNGKKGSPEAYFFTLEQGTYAIPYEGSDDEFFGKIVERLAPLATSNLIIENDFVPDLPEELWKGDEITASITRAGRHLD